MVVLQWWWKDVQGIDSSIAEGLITDRAKPGNRRQATDDVCGVGASECPGADTLRASNKAPVRHASRLNAPIRRHEARQFGLSAGAVPVGRSEERRVGKECSSGGSVTATERQTRGR